MKGTKETDAIKFAMVERWQLSQQTKTEFCKSEGIAFHMFYYWHKKYQKQNTVASKFIKIAIQAIPRESIHYGELYFTNGMRLVFNEAPDASFIKQLL